jgi:hypothetical protein
VRCGRYNHTVVQCHARRTINGHKLR